MNLGLDIAAFLSFLATIGFWIYKAWKSRQGRHVVCIQEQPTFSHLSLSERAREWVEVKYVGSDEHSEPTEIETLSQIVIDVRNDSDMDALNNVQLEFCVPEARVLNVWWQEVPPYLSEESDLAYFPEKDFPDDVDPAAEAPWKVQVCLPQLKSFKKYKEIVKVGILANGELDSVDMLPQGSKGGVPSDQVWTAKFVRYEAVLEARGRRAEQKLTLSTFFISLFSLIALGGLALWRLGRLDEVLVWASENLGLLPMTALGLGVIVVSVVVGVAGRIIRSTTEWRQVARELIAD